MSLCLIIATYNGNYLNSSRLPNKVIFNNLKCLLENTNLNLFNKIIIVISKETEEKYINIKYNTYLESLQNTDKIVVLWKQNDQFLSYSSYYEGYKYDQSHDYYFFVEDDYILSNKYVDISIETINKNKWGYIFGDINYNHPTHIHACHCLCVAKKDSLEKIFINFYDRMINVGLPHQMAFFYLFKESKIPGEDFKNTNYSLMFWTTSTQTYLFYSNLGCENIVWPIQYFFYNRSDYPNNTKYDNYIL